MSPLIMLPGSKLPPFWARTLGSISETEIYYDTTVDPSGNIIGGGYSKSGSSRRPLLAKYNSSGSLLWQKIWGSSSSGAIQSLSTDSSGNIYTMANIGSGIDITVAKFNSSGVVQWQEKRDPTGDFSIPCALVADSAGNVFTGMRAANVSNTLGNDALIEKWNTSGVIQWQTRIGDVYVENVGGMALDGSGNVYICGTHDPQIPTAFRTHIMTAKLNSSGVVQWMRAFGGTGTYEAGVAVGVDSSGNVYSYGSSDAGDNMVVLIKYNSSGTVQWDKRLRRGFTDNLAYDMKLDADGNPYVLLAAQSTVGAVIVKFDSSGVVQWKRELSEMTGRALVLNPSASGMYIAGSSSTLGVGGVDAVLAALPLDGTGLGSCGSMTYSVETNQADAASGLSQVAHTMTGTTLTPSIGTTDLGASVTDPSLTPTDVCG